MGLKSTADGMFEGKCPEMTGHCRELSTMNGANKWKISRNDSQLQRAFVKTWCEWTGNIPKRFVITESFQQE